MLILILTILLILVNLGAFLTACFIGVLVLIAGAFISEAEANGGLTPEKIATIEARIIAKFKRE